MTFAQGKLYEDRAALLNITSNTANWKVSKLGQQMGSENGKQNNNTSYHCGHWLFGYHASRAKKDGITEWIIKELKWMYGYKLVAD